MKAPSDARQPYGSARMRLLGRLQGGPVWTLDLRREPERWSANPAQRVAELRNSTPVHDIRTLRAWLYNDSGESLLTAQYRDYYVLVVGTKAVDFRCVSLPWRDALWAAWEQKR